MPDFTIAICARNAAATVARAIASCLPEPDCPILLVDDQSSDDTVARASAVAGSRLRVVRTEAPGGVGCARQQGLVAIATPWAAWLDADDEWVPGRIARLRTQLEAGCDVVSDAIDLIDGATGAYLRRLTAPAFLSRPAAAVRLFERNFLPGDTQVAFRVAAFRAAGGYDPALAGPESFDLLLRAIARGARVGFASQVGYRMHAYAGSLSRNLARQRAALAAALAKHAYADVRNTYVRAGYSRRIAAWALVSMALYREDAASALAFLDLASPRESDPAEVLEPDGPWPMREGWRRAFARGTALLMNGAPEAARHELEQAESLEPSAEAANNLGVAIAAAGDSGAATWFAVAAERFPGYLDARLNAASARPSHVTTHPLRRFAARSEYPG